MRNKVNFCLLVKLFVFASFHPPVHTYVRVDKAVVGGTAGPAMAGPLFWPKMVLAGPLFRPIIYIFLFFGRVIFRLIKT